ncbi:putative phosphatidylinositol 4-kinase pik1alpha protein [Phaeoacremonium minimum UCRPA7]|uniref:Putative phosphatidylinositol 4-kinase pik1alpha protein n=1 Tax=Phaeoacremonium minimum (strain UCR-PA7) TaxID=1286976 RepID=R8BFF7_PHAM7|nr:putative phosphatidylinositol 4-kinase pik1alpha protein [Phaeoacremonium minimum UCRPA7]EON98033.1 putative phosphatidylinositol 4-kinase pik1alpha protein [Phaeoacremonium minimum UCRPA7]
MAPDDRSLEQRSDGHRHEWTTFEFDIMLSLICKGTHLHGIVEFATKFNEGLNGAGYSGHRRDVDMEDIQEILLYILDKKKAAVAFIERQHMPRVTRAQKRVFMRSINFTGTLKEWKIDGRKDEEALEHPNRVRQMVERQQKEQFLRDFERHVEQQDMQRGHQRLAGELGDTADMLRSQPGFS